MEFLYPQYNPYRVLFLDTPMLRGEDVYALQTALKELGTYDTPNIPAKIDGIFGQKTQRAVKRTQRHLQIFDDGKSGPITQREIVLALVNPLTIKYNFPEGLLTGQITHESGMILGNYSRPIRFDGSYDVGVTQRNSKLTDPKFGFDVVDSVNALSKRVREYFDLFKGIPTIRRWMLAQGSWNAPAFACYLAKKEGAQEVPSSRLPSFEPTSGVLATFEAYMRAVSTYIIL